MGDRNPSDFIHIFPVENMKIFSNVTDKIIYFLQDFRFNFQCRHLTKFSSGHCIWQNVIFIINSPRNACNDQVGLPTLENVMTSHSSCCRKVLNENDVNQGFIKSQFMFKINTCLIQLYSK